MDFGMNATDDAFGCNALIPSRTSSCSSQSSILVKGEKVLSRHNCLVKLSGNRNNGFNGTAVLTNHSLVFVREGGAGFSVPYGLMSKIKKGANTLTVTISCKDVRDIDLVFDKSTVHAQFSSRLRQAMSQASFPFQYTADEYQLERNGWLIFDPIREYSRLGMKSGKWRMSFINTNLQVIPSYPKCFCVPASVSDDDLVKAAAFRRLHRVPVVQWRHATNGSVLMRAGQPRVGLYNAHCTEDERIVRAAVDAMGNDGRLVHVFDCRTERSARAHWAFLGGGGEEGRKEAYGIARYVFLGLHNAACQKAYHDEITELAKPMNNKTLRNLRQFTAIMASHWFQQISALIEGACDIASVLEHRKGSALVHCSDGLNRTTQVVSLAEILLDPYYRTLVGFEALVEKEWSSMGHQFASRLGHNKQKKGMQSPIFLQWLECVWQIMQAAQEAFEFNEDLLLVVADAALAGRHGTFFFDSLKEAEEKKCRERTVSLWTEVNANRDMFTHKGTYRRREGMLPVEVENMSMQLWARFYTRHADGEWPTNHLLSTVAQLQDDALAWHIVSEAAPSYG